MGSTPLLTSAEMAALDRRTIDQLGVPGLVLMESAAWACCQELLASFGDRLHAGVLIACGPGNNGGDGLAIARRLHGLGLPVEACLLCPEEELSGDAATQAQLARTVGVPITAWSQAPTTSWEGRGVLVDALFGTGLTRPIEGAALELISALRGARQAGVPVLSVDIPSGVCGSRGAVLGAAVEADVTVTFATLKLGHFLAPGAAHRGRLVRADIGIPVDLSLPEVSDAALLLDARNLRAALPPADRSAHKGSFGHVLVVAGGPGKEGAARLCAEAALRSGAGLVTLASPRGSSVAGLAPEVMTEAFDPGSEGTATLLRLAATRSALAVGPGLGTDAATMKAVAALYSQASVPGVFDADALNCLAALESTPGAPAGPRILTPHPGEMARLCSAPWAEIAPHKLRFSAELAQGMEAVVVLKGAGTVVVDPGARCWVNPTGNPGMGTAGSGDVLTGVIAGLLARGVEPAAAAGAAVFWHGLAGDLAAAESGEPGVIASALINWLAPAWWAASEDGVPPSFHSTPPLPGAP